MTAAPFWAPLFAGLFFGERNDFEGASLLAIDRVIVPTLCVGMPPGTLRVPLSMQTLVCAETLRA